MTSSFSIAASCLIVAEVFRTGAMAGLPLPAAALTGPADRVLDKAPGAAQALTIRAHCTGGLLPLDRDVTVSTAGTTLVRVAGRVSTGRIDPQKVLRLSARLDANGFDTIMAPVLPSVSKADARKCALVRTSAKGTHGISISRDTPVELRRVLDELLRIAVKPDPAGAEQ